MVVTEREVMEARDGRLVVPPWSILTPLARDCARRLGVRIVEEAAAPRIFVNLRWFVSPRTAPLYVDALRAKLLDSRVPDVVLLAPATLLPVLARLLRPHDRIALGAQHFCPFDAGAYTGEVSAAMLRDLGVLHALVAHQDHGEGWGRPQAHRIEVAWNHGIAPILVLPVTPGDREDGRSFPATWNRLSAVLGALRAAPPDALVVALAFDPTRRPRPPRGEPREEIARHLLARARATLPDAVAGRIRFVLGGKAQRDAPTESFEGFFVDDARAEHPSLYTI